MPYNNTAIPPSEEITGTAALPLARVKKILLADDEIGPVSNNAAFVTTLATEMFVRYFSEQAQNQAKTDTKPRRNIQYKDLANAVARLDNLEFLSDVVPRSTTMREYQAKKARESGEVITRRARPLPTGQTMLDRSRTSASHIADQVHSQDTIYDEEDAASPVEYTSRPVVAQSANGYPCANGNGGLVFEHYEPNGSTAHHSTEDTDMV